MNSLAQNHQTRENALRHEISWLSEHFPEIQLVDIELIGRIAFTAGITQGINEAGDQFQNLLDRLDASVSARKAQLPNELPQ